MPPTALKTYYESPCEPWIHPLISLGLAGEPWKVPLVLGF